MKGCTSGWKGRGNKSVPKACSLLRELMWVYQTLVKPCTAMWHAASHVRASWADVDNDRKQSREAGQAVTTPLE